MTQSPPNYRVLASSLRSAIGRGEYADGRKLPTEAELAESHGLSRQTVRRAFQELVAEGMVYRVPGRGTFAAEAAEGYVRQFGSVDDLMGLSEDTGMELVRPLRRRVDLVTAGRLRLTSDVVYELAFVRIHDGIRFCATTVWLPPRVASLLSDVAELDTVGATSDVTVIGLLDGRMSSPIVEAHQSITVGAISVEDAESLHCEPGRSSLRVDRLYLDSTGEAVELAISHFLPEHYSYRVSLRRHGDGFA